MALRWFRFAKKQEEEAAPEAVATEDATPPEPQAEVVADEPSSPAGPKKKRRRGNRGGKGRKKPAAASDATPKDADTLALEKLLSDVTGLKVAINHKERGGEIRIGYRTLEQLDELCRRLQG